MSDQEHDAPHIEIYACSKEQSDPLWKDPEGSLVGQLVGMVLREEGWQYENDTEKQTSINLRIMVPGGGVVYCGLPNIVFLRLAKFAQAAKAEWDDKGQPAKVLSLVRPKESNGETNGPKS